MSMIEKLEKKYGIRIVKENNWAPYSDKPFVTYTIYSADGNRWETCFGYKALLAELREWGEGLKRIAQSVSR